MAVVITVVSLEMALNALWVRDARYTWYMGNVRNVVRGEMSGVLPEGRRARTHYGRGFYVPKDKRRPL